MLHHDNMLRWSRHVSSSCPTPDPGSCEGYILPISYLSGSLARLFWCKSVLPSLASTSTRHLVKVAAVVRKADSMQHGHRCACICGSMEAYRSESAISIHDKQNTQRQSTASS